VTVPPAKTVETSNCLMGIACVDCDLHVVHLHITSVKSSNSSFVTLILYAVDIDGITFWPINKLDTTLKTYSI